MDGNVITKIKNLYLVIFIFTLFSGAIRKWLPISDTSANVIFLLQILIPFSFLFVRDVSGSFIRTTGLKWYFFLLVLMALNPLNLTIYHGLFGIILHLSFWVMMMFYIDNSSLFNLKSLSRILVIFCFIEILIGFVQYQLPPEHWLNQYANFEAAGIEKNVAKVGSAVRITGTFSYLSGFTAFLIFLIFFIWALVRYNYNMLVVALLWVAGIFCCFMSGSRGATLQYIIISALMCLTEFKKETYISFLRYLWLPFLLGLLFFLYKGKIGIESQLGAAYDNFASRVNVTAASGEQNSRVIQEINDIVDFRGNYPIFGVGLGATYQGATAMFGTSSYVQDYGYYEGEIPRIILEGGFTLVAAKFVLMILMLWNLRFKLIVKVGLFFIMSFFNPLVFNIYNIVFAALGLMILDAAASQKRVIKIT